MIIDLGSQRVGEAEVWVDGTYVGHRTGGGPTAKWIGITTRPLELVPGTHVIELRNRYSEPARHEVTVSAGERATVRPILRRLQVEFIVNTQIPNECSLTVGKDAYSPLSAFRTFQLRDPDPAPPVVVTCPDRTIKTTLEHTEPGQTYILPPRVDP